MATVAELEIIVKAEMAGVTSQLSKLKKQIGGIEPGIKKTEKSFLSLSKAGGLLARAGLAKVIFDFGKAALVGAAELEQNTVAIEVLTGSAVKAATIIKELKELGAKTPFETADLIVASKTLLNFGVSADKTVDTIKMLSNVASGNAEKMKSLALVFGQISSLGRLQGQDLLQLINAGYNPLLDISKRTGESMKQLKERMSAGAITSKEVEQAFKDATSEGGKFFQMNERQSQTTLGLWSTLKDTIGEVAIVIGQELNPATKEALSLFQDFAGMTKFLVDTLREPTFEEIQKTREEVAELTKSIESNRALVKEMASFNAIANAEEIADTNQLIKRLEEKRQKLLGVDKTIKNSSKKAKEDSTIVDNVASNKAIKEYEANRKAFEAINAEYEKRKIKASGDANKIISFEELQELKKLADLKSITEAERLSTQKVIEDDFRRQREEAERQSYLNIATTALSIMSQFTGQLSGIVSQYFTNRNIENDNAKIKALANIEDTYNAEVAAIENSVLSAAQKTAQLKVLDEKRARDEKKINDKTEKEKRKLAREAFVYTQAIAISNSIINTAQAVGQALAHLPPPFSYGVAAVSAALGAAQTTLIANQPPPALAEGGFFQGPALIGEAGREFAFPLDGPQGKKAMEEMAGSILDVMSQTIDRSATISQGSSSGGGGGGDVYLDGSLVGKWIQDGTKNGDIFIDDRSLIAS